MRDSNVTLICCPLSKPSAFFCDLPWPLLLYRHMLCLCLFSLRYLSILRSCFFVPSVVIYLCRGGMIPYFETGGVSEVGNTSQSLFNSALRTWSLKCHSSCSVLFHYYIGSLPVVWNPGWSRQFWANCSPVFPIEIIIFIIVIVVVPVIMFGTVFLF